MAVRGEGLAAGAGGLVPAAAAARRAALAVEHRHQGPHQPRPHRAPPRSHAPTSLGLVAELHTGVEGGVTLANNLTLFT